MEDPVLQEIAALTDHDWAVREDAAIRLGRLKDPRAIGPLVTTLRDPDRSVREAAIQALLAIGSPSTAAVCACLADPDLTVQESASKILASIADAEALVPLLSALNSSDWIVRMYAAKALGRLNDPRVVVPLLRLLQDPVRTVREEASAALVTMGHLAVPPLIEALAHSDWMVRLRAIESLRMIRAPEAVPALLMRVCHDPDSAIREDAVRALGVIRDERAVEPLITVVTQQPKLRLAAIEALGVIGDRRAVPVLIEIARQTTASGSSLSSIVDGVLPPDSTLLEQNAAVRALGMIGDDSSLPILATALTCAATRQEAAQALFRFGHRAVPWLQGILRGAADASTHHLARRLLASLQGPVDDACWGTASTVSPAIVINRRAQRDIV